MSNDPIIKIEQLEKSFGDLHVLKGIDLEVDRGEVVCIIGASGSGKSTLLRCINLLEEADSGHIWFDGQDLMDLKVNLNALRQKIGMVFQGFNLFNNKSVLDNCTLAPASYHRRAVDPWILHRHNSGYFCNAIHFCGNKHKGCHIRRKHQKYNQLCGYGHCKAQQRHANKTITTASILPLYRR